MCFVPLKYLDVDTLVLFGPSMCVCTKATLDTSQALENV